jgi:hypothetical protein
MGDKSPKSIARTKKQAAAEKTRKQIVAHAKANPEPIMPTKKPKK